MTDRSDGVIAVDDVRDGDGDGDYVPPFSNSELLHAALEVVRTFGPDKVLSPEEIAVYSVALEFIKRQLKCVN